MGGATAELASPHPLGATLPGQYAQDQITQVLCAALDQMLAPAIAALDNLPAYLNLATAPDHLVPWLAHWVGMPLQAQIPVARQRELLQSAVHLQGWQGTARGLQLALEATFGASAVVDESGAATWSTDPHAPLPGDQVPSVTVRVSTPQEGRLDTDQVDAVVAAVTPAHVLRRVEVQQ